MATNLKLITTETVVSGSSNPVIIPTGAITNLASTYFINVYSTGSLVYIVPADSGETLSGKPVFSGSAVQDGPYVIDNIPNIYFPSADGTVYVTFVQVVSEGR